MAGWGLLANLARRLAGGAARGYAGRLSALSEADEVELLNWILCSGVDQGWFIRPRPSDLLLSDERGLDRVLRAAAERACQPEASAPDPFPDSAYAATEISGAEPGYIVVSQRCDLVRPLTREPFVELARTRFYETKRDQKVIDAAKKNSARWIHLADGSAGAWIADLAQPALLAKDALPQLGPGVHPIAELRARRRLALRLGQRRARTPVPSEYVKTLQRPLIKLLLKNATNRAHGEKFSEFLGVRKDGKVQLIAIVAEAVMRKDANDAYNAIEALMSAEARSLLHEDSGAMTLEDLNFWLYLQAFKLDFDEVTFSSKSSTSQAMPHI